MRRLKMFPLSGGEGKKSNLTLGKLAMMITITMNFLYLPTEDIMGNLKVKAGYILKNQNFPNCVYLLEITR